MTSQNAKDTFQSNGDFLDSFVRDGVGVIHLKDKAFEIATDFSLKANLFKKIQQARESPAIKVLLFLNNESIFGEEKNTQFFRRLHEEDEGIMLLYREENALAQFIETMCGFEKIVISAVQGSVVGAFLGAILSTDFRLASRNTVFSFPYVRYGLPPQGALPLLLPRYVGRARAKSIIMRAEPISAMHALEFGLVDSVYPGADFERSCLQFAGKLTGISTDSVGMTKRLFEGSMKEVQEYFRLEAKLVGLHKLKLPEGGR